MPATRRFILAVPFAAALFAGCASPLPTYPPMPDAAALATIAARQATVKSLSAQCDLDLTDARGQRISLDAVLVAQPPGRLRLRAWKFGQAAFDLTLVGGEAWIMSPDDGAGVAQGRRPDLSRLSAQRIRDALDLLGPAYFRTASPVAGEPGTLRTQGPALGLDDVTCEIDRATLTPRRFLVGNSNQPAPGELILDQYEPVHSIIWPMRIRLLGPTGQVMVRIRDLELNGDIPAEAFTPPARARALP